jgi:methylglutaconyl-CoA hydratase
MAAIQLDRGPVTTVTLNRPDVRNAFNEEMIEELSAFAAEAAADRSIRAIVLRDSLPVPVIGRIHGAALGGGSGLAAICDVVVAAEDAVFGFTEVVLGILPAMISPYVVRKIGLSYARELCLSGARFTAARAKEIGLVHTVVAADGLDAAVSAHLDTFSKASPTAVAATKKLLAEVHGRKPGDVLALTVENIAAQRVSPEGQEGLRAFLEKRPAAWTKTNPGR